MARTAPTAAPLRRALRGRAPGLRAERALWSGGAEVVAGVDEVGRGSWAGPLTVAAVVAEPDKRIYKVRDSKMLTSAEREVLHDRIKAWARAVSVGHATVTECTDLGMADAQRLAARRAIDGVGLRVDHVLVDGSWDFLTSRPDETSRPTETSRPDDAVDTDTDRDDDPEVTTIVRGDASSLSIAAASVVAKVTRDRLMVAAADRYPAYWFASNKGYPCPRHIAALAAWGPSSIHRRRWVFMNDLRWTGVPRVLPPPEDAHPQLFDAPAGGAAAAGGPL